MGSKSHVCYGGPFLLQDDAKDVDVVFASRRQTRNHVSKFLIFALHLSVFSPIPYSYKVFGTDAYT